MTFFNKLERKFGKYAIHNLMYYIMILYAAGILVGLINPLLYPMFLALDARAVLDGQVWRLVTFLICQPGSGILFNLIAIYLYYSLGRTLESYWGAFRFNVYFFMGVIGLIIASFAIYFMTGISVPLSTYYLNNSLLLAFVVMFPNTQFYFYGVLPIKAKWLGLFYGAEFVYEFFFGGLAAQVAIGMSFLNFIVFFIITKGKQIDPKVIKRRQEFKTKMKTAQVQKIILSRHKCSVCGRTDKDNPDLEFRYCSKCEGNREYCMDHLYTHRHVTKKDINADGEL